MFPVFAAFMLKSTVLLAAAWVAALLLGGQSAATRHMVWVAAAVGVLALPFLTGSIPGLSVPVPASANIVFRANASVASPPAPAHAPATATNIAPRAAAIPRRLFDWRSAVMLLWMAGALASFAKMLLAYSAVWRMKRSAKPSEAQQLCAHVVNALGIRQTVTVLETEAGGVPMLSGMVRPIIFIPGNASEWTEDRRRVVLLHELAHVRRGDLFTHLLARLAFCLCWFNPLAWLAWREFLHERERAADDLVLNTGAIASDYASHLLDVARGMRPAFGSAAVAMARPSQLEGRLRAILDSGTNRRAPGRAAILLAVVLTTGIVAPLAALRAQTPPQDAPADPGALILAALSQKNHELLDSAAKAAEMQGNYDVARTLLDSSVAVRAQVAGTESVSYGIGLMNLGDLEKQRAKPDSAKDFYTRAAAVLGNHPEAGHAWIELGFMATAEKDYAGAESDFERARVVDPDHAAMAWMWQAVAANFEKKTDQAEQYYWSATDAAPAGSREATIVLKVFSRFLRMQGQNDEAAKMEARAAASELPAAAAVLPPGVNRIGPGIKAPSVLRKVDPEYSEEARIAKLSGTVTLSAEVGTDGLAHNITVLKPLGLGLDEKAVAAVSKWRFQPGAKDEQPVSVLAVIEINFRLL